jgi:hypothetical protein
MAVATGYLVNKNYGYNTQQIYRIAQKVLDSSKLKFGGFNWKPVIFKIPSGYARTGVYIRQYADDGGNMSDSFYLGVCDFDTLGDRTETTYGGNDGTGFVAVYDTGEFVVTLLEMYAMELLDPVSLNPVGFMAWFAGLNSAIFVTQNTVTQGSVTTILPEPIRTGDTVKVSRVYFLTPLGIVTTRHLYSANIPNTRVSMSIQIGSSKLVHVGSYFIDVTEEV